MVASTGGFDNLLLDQKNYREKSFNFLVCQLKIMSDGYSYSSKKTDDICEDVCAQVRDF